MILTVIFPVYNAEHYLEEALDCILRQTFKEFTILAINDGSTDGSLAILERYKARDNRVIIIDQPNCKLVPTLNMALARVRTPLVARHDADDYSHPKRFEHQVRFLENHSEIGLLGTTFLVSVCGREDPQWIPCNHEQIRNHIILGNCFAHGSIMARTSILHSVGGYPETEDTRHVEDMALWVRLTKVTKVHNLPEILYVYREYPQNVSSRNREDQVRRAKLLSAYFTDWYFKEVHPDIRLSDVLALTKPDLSDPYLPGRRERLRWILELTAQVAFERGHYADAIARREALEILKGIN